jgi:hypothetical protein
MPLELCIDTAPSRFFQPNVFSEVRADLVPVLLPIPAFFAADPPSARELPNAAAPNYYQSGPPCTSFQPEPPLAPISGDPRPFDPADAHISPASVIYAAAPPEGSQGFNDPFHFDWPYW